jgi:hypothetical protein
VFTSLLRGGATLLRTEVGPSGGVIHSDLDYPAGLLRIHDADVHQPGVLAGPVQNPAFGWCRRLDLGTGTGSWLFPRGLLRIPEATRAGLGKLRQRDGERGLVIVLPDDETVLKDHGRCFRLPAGTAAAGNNHSGDQRE